MYKILISYQTYIPYIYSCNKYAIHTQWILNSIDFLLNSEYLYACVSLFLTLTLGKITERSGVLGIFHKVLINGIILHKWWCCGMKSLLVILSAWTFLKTGREKRKFLFSSVDSCLEEFLIIFDNELCQYAAWGRRWRKTFWLFLSMKECLEHFFYP